MPLNKTIPCPRCDRKFAMPRHLARHLSSTHGMKKKGKAKLSKNGKRLGRPPGSKSTRVSGRKSSAGKHGLGNMSLEQLGDLISRARDAAQKQLKRLQSAFS